MSHKSRLFSPFIAVFIFLTLTLGATKNAQAAGDTATVDSFKVASTYTSKAATDPFGRSVAATTIRFRLFVPKNYNPAVKYPIVLTMHGSGEGGTDNRAQLKYRFNRMWADDSIQAVQPMFVLAPQSTSANFTWTTVPSTQNSISYPNWTINPPMEAVIQLFDSLLTAYSIDTTRLYVSGLSAGGYATYYLLNRFPKRWAAAAPVCACGDTSRVQLNTWIKTPIWVHHGSVDPTVNVNCSRQMFAALNQAYAASPKDTANTMRYSEYAGVNHFSWENASRDPRLMPWMLGKVMPVGIKPRVGTKTQNLPPFAAKKPVDILGRRLEAKPLYGLNIFLFGGK
jgi:predicted peptidase